MSPASRVVAGTRFTSRPFPPALLGWPVPFGGDFSSLTAGVFRPTTVSLPFFFFFTNTPVILILGVADVLSLSLVAEVSLPACTPGFPLWISILLCSQPPGTLWHRRTFSPFSPRTRPLLA